jgi:8-oxo-dGTP diphosphatase
MKQIRTAPKAIIIHDGMLLVTCNRDDQGVFYLLPGGGQQYQETLPEALRRECLEEVGARVKVEALLFVREYISAHHEFAACGPDEHQVEFMFRCELEDGQTPTTGTAPDKWQVQIAWLPIEDLANHRLYPAALKGPIALLAQKEIPGSCYLGDVN